MIAMGYAYTTDVAPTAPVALADNTAPYMPEGRLRGDQQERALNPGDQVSIVAPQLIRKAEVLQIIEVVHENKSPKSAALECYHKTLPVGTIVQMLLPDNPGFIELKVIGNLQKNEGLGLPPGTIRRIFGDIIPPNVNVEYLATLK
jgi:hypothetical protein